MDRVILPCWSCLPLQGEVCGCRRLSETRLYPRSAQGVGRVVSLAPRLKWHTIGGRTQCNMTTGHRQRSKFQSQRRELARPGGGCEVQQS